MVIGTLRKRLPVFIRLTGTLRKRLLVFIQLTRSLLKSVPVRLFFFYFLEVKLNFHHTGTLLEVFRCVLFFLFFIFFYNFFIVVRRRGADGRIPDRDLGRSASTSATESAGYPGGSYDMSLLIKYEHHVAHHLWFGEVNKRRIFEIE